MKIKITFKFYNNLIKTINYETKKYYNKSFINFNSYGVYKYLYVIAIDLSLKKLVKVSKFDITNIFQK